MAALAIVSGCGGAASPPTTPATPSAFCDAANRIEQPFFVQCYGPDFGGDDSYCASLDGLLAKGTIAFDPSTAADCLSTIEALGARICTTSHVPCFDAVISGKLASGDACTTSAECPAGAFCEPLDPTTCGATVCVPASGPGSRCDAVTCAATQKCIYGYCMDVLAQEGEPCHMGGGFADCDFGLDCLPGGADGGVCGAPYTGAPCTLTDECLLSDYCDSTCKPRLPVGSSCRDNAEACVLLAACDAKTKTCVAAGRPGQACGEDNYCVKGSCTVGYSTLTCLADAPVGTPCEDGVECASGVCNQTCVACPP